MQELTEIGKIRRKQGLTQSELAKAAGVSQSLVAKLEAGKIEPSYTSVRKLFSALAESEKRAELKAFQLINQKIIFTSPQITVREAILTMKKQGVSQLPVIQKEKVVGLVSEGAILEKMELSPEKLFSLKVEDIMEEVPPIVSPQTGQEVISHLLRSFPLVLVAERGEVKGVITKSDLLEKMR
jgi:predicted transcriptional regulator